jgi:hypothetical protein
MLAAVLVAGCGDDTADRSSGTSTPAEQAATDFCSDLGDTIAILERYGRIFTEEPITVGDVQDDAAALGSSTATLEASAATLSDAIEATNEAAVQSGASTTTVLATKTAEEHLEDIEEAQRAWTRAAAQVTPETALRDAAIELQSAAFGLEQAYLSLFVDAGCVPPR